MRYAAIVAWGTQLALAVLVVTFVLYIFGIVEPLVPRPAVVEHWQESAEQFAAATGSPRGWHWLEHITAGDYLCFVGLTVLGVLTIIAFFSLLPAYFKRGNWTYFTIACLQIAVLALAASNLLGGLGGH